MEYLHDEEILWDTRVFVQWLVFWDTLLLMWHDCNEDLYPKRYPIFMLPSCARNRGGFFASYLYKNIHNKSRMHCNIWAHRYNTSQITKFMGPTWGPPGSCRPQMGPMLALWTLLSWILQLIKYQLLHQSSDNLLFRERALSAYSVNAMVCNVHHMQQLTNWIMITVVLILSHIYMSMNNSLGPFT